MALTPIRFDHIAKQLLAEIPFSLQNIPNEMEQKIQQILQTAFAKLNLVTREEFDAQVRVLQRTRAKLEMLEQMLAKGKQCDEIF